MPLKRGMSISEALERWADGDRFRAMQELADAASWPGPNASHEAKLRHHEYETRRERAIESLIARLPDGDILASGLLKHSTEGRVIINPELWHMLEYYEDFDHAMFEFTEYRLIEFFASNEVPQNIRSLPSWLPKAAFKHDATYTHVELDGDKFTLSVIQGKIIKQLHEVAYTESPWANGKRLLEAAGANVEKLRTAFAPATFNKLIESDQRGGYRLRLPRG